MWQGDGTACWGRCAVRCAASCMMPAARAQPPASAPLFCSRHPPPRLTLAMKAALLVAALLLAALPAQVIRNFELRGPVCRSPSALSMPTEWGSLESSLPAAVEPAGGSVSWAWRPPPWRAPLSARACGHSSLSSQPHLLDTPPCAPRSRLQGKVAAPAPAPAAEPLPPTPAPAPAADIPADLPCRAPAMVYATLEECEQAIAAGVDVAVAQGVDLAALGVEVGRNNTSSSVSLSSERGWRGWLRLLHPLPPPPSLLSANGGWAAGAWRFSARCACRPVCPPAARRAPSPPPAAARSQRRLCQRGVQEDGVRGEGGLVAVGGNGSLGCLLFGRCSGGM